MRDWRPLIVSTCEAARGRGGGRKTGRWADGATGRRTDLTKEKGSDGTKERRGDGATGRLVERTRERQGERTTVRWGEGATGRRTAINKCQIIIKFMKKIKTHKDLNIYQLSFESGMNIFKISKNFPKEEIYSLTNQLRRSSRSVSGNIVEAFRKRKYPKSFISKLTDAEGEAAETQVWLDYSMECVYLEATVHQNLFDKYDHIISMLVNMSSNPDSWSI